MSLLAIHPLPQVTALLAGKLPRSEGAGGFDIRHLSAWRLDGITPPPGAADFGIDQRWEAVVRGWWSLGATWGLCVETHGGTVSWRVVLPDHLPGTLALIPAHLPGAQLTAAEPLATVTARLKALPNQQALAGHSAVGPNARLDFLLEAAQQESVTFLVLAQPVNPANMEEELRVVLDDERFLQEEHLNRPVLGHESHPEATQCLDLLAAIKTRLLSAQREGGWRVRSIVAARDAACLASAQAAIHAAYADAEASRPEPMRWQTVTDRRSLTFMRSAEVAALTRPPAREFPGFAMTVQGRAGAAGDNAGLFGSACTNYPEGNALAVGRIVADNGNPAHWLELPLKDLTRHLLIAGMTGSGKSVACEHLLLSLWLEHRVPWLVVEPGMKPGYRRLLHSEVGKDLQVIAIGAPSAARPPLNPLHLPPGASLADHCASLHAVLASVFELVAPMPEVLATAIERTYQRHGWNLHQPAPVGHAPGFLALVREVETVVEEAGYGREITGNLRAGLLLRLQRLARGPLAPELTTAEGLNAAALTARPAIIELCAVPDADSQALVMGLIALQLRHHWQALGPSDSLRHVLVLEEAHRLLRQVADHEDNTARLRAVEDLSQMLAELRGFGAGLVVVDQTPSALTSSVLANTASKLVMRLGHATDRDSVGRSVGLPTSHVDLLASLPPGMAIFQSDRSPRPFRLKMPNPALQYGALPLPPLPTSDSSVVFGQTESLCEVCQSAPCAAARLGADPVLQIERLRALQIRLAESEQAVRQWAQEQLLLAGLPSTETAWVACFLVALGRASGLSNSLLATLRQRFSQP